MYLHVRTGTQVRKIPGHAQMERGWKWQEECGLEQDEQDKQDKQCLSRILTADLWPAADSRAGLRCAQEQGAVLQMLVQVRHEWLQAPVAACTSLPASARSWLPK